MEKDENEKANAFRTNMYVGRARGRGRRNQVSRRTAGCTLLVPTINN